MGFFSIFPFFFAGGIFPWACGHGMKKNIKTICPKGANENNKNQFPRAPGGAKIAKPSCFLNTIYDFLPSENKTLGGLGPGVLLKKMFAVVGIKGFAPKGVWQVFGQKKGLTTWGTWRGPNPSSLIAI